MAYMIQIEENELDEVKELAAKALKHTGKLLERVESLCEESQMGERETIYGNREASYGNRYGNRGGADGGGSYGNRYGNRDEDWEDEEADFGQRRGRSSRTGRFVRR